MQIQLVYNKDAEEVMLWELHGAVDCTDEVSLNGQLMGNLQWITEKDVLLLIGSSFIRGKVIELESPMLLTKPPSRKELSEETDGVIEITHIVTKKVVFRTKPYDFVESILPKMFAEIDEMEEEGVESV